MSVGLAGKIVITGDKLRKACDIEGTGHENRGKSDVIPFGVELELLFQLDEALDRFWYERRYFK